MSNDTNQAPPAAPAEESEVALAFKLQQCKNEIYGLAIQVAARDEQLASLTADLAKADKRIEEQSAEWRQIRDEKITLQSDLAAARKDAEEAKAERDNMAGFAAAVEMGLEWTGDGYSWNPKEGDYREKPGDAIWRHGHNINMERSRLTATITALRAELEACKSDFNALLEGKTLALTERDAATAQLAAREAEVAGLKAKLETNKAAMGFDKASLVESLEVKTAALDRWHAESQGLIAERDALQAERDSALTASEDFLRNGKLWQERAEKAESEAAALREELEKAEERNAMLQGHLNDFDMAASRARNALKSIGSPEIENGVALTLADRIHRIGSSKVVAEQSAASLAQVIAAGHPDFPDPLGTSGSKLRKFVHRAESLIAGYVAALREELEALAKWVEVNVGSIKGPSCRKCGRIVAKRVNGCCKECDPMKLAALLPAQPVKQPEGLPTPEQHPNGLHGRYRITKHDGTPCDPRAFYFVLRLDPHGDDPEHIKACQKAALAYVAHSPKHLRQMASELQDRVCEFMQPEKPEGFGRPKLPSEHARDSFKQPAPEPSPAEATVAPAPLVAFEIVNTRTGEKAWANTYSEEDEEFTRHYEDGGYITYDTTRGWTRATRTSAAGEGK